MDDETSILKTQLYAACVDACSDTPDRLFSQEDLMSLDVIPPKDVKKLLQIIQILTRERLFAPVHFHSGLAWRIRPEAEAEKYVHYVHYALFAPTILYSDRSLTAPFPF